MITVSQLSIILIFGIVCFEAGVLGSSDELDYAVYFDVDDDKPNPFGKGFDPKSPPDWKKVDLYPIFADWGEILDDQLWWQKGNMCQDESHADYNDKHRQSPVILTADDRCEDTEPIFHVLKGKCAKDEIRFETTPYGLNAVFEDCKEIPVIEHSLNDDPWKLVHMVLKVPAEHQVNDYGDVERYDAELQLHYKGSDYYDQGLNGHAENIAVTSIFLEARGSREDDEIEKYILGWEKFQKKQYEDCGVEYDDENCALSGDRNPDHCDKCFENGCCTYHRGLNHAADGIDFNSLNKDDAGKFVREQEREIKRLKSVLTDCDEDESSSMDRELWRERRSDGDCNGSYYCLLDLYRNTGTEFYYNYRGSLTVPPCTENVHWRIMIDPIIVSVDQMERLEELTYKHIKYPFCKLTTVGKPRVRSRCKVDVSRPIQALSRKHNLQMCDSFTDELYAVEVEDEDKDEDKNKD